jgi:hypothetical protein
VSRTTSSNPYGSNGTIGQFYKHVGTGDGGRACAYFKSDEPKKAFAEAFGASDCPAAVAKLKGQVTDVTTYRQLVFPQTMVTPPASGSVEVSSCALDVRSGPKLGKFVLTKQTSGAWAITGYTAEPSCP